ncbi:serine/threonine protein kinase [Mycolicibacterium rhodesiae NBB3]|jgi:serine/threonine-protein kinase|uniref:non-specific serine/threonine protein kinase n=1 Tax=Mycolicibacterium rhodesiae (strain NBB3) TaxID=710685 RepID=G8RHX9_MYCRN|nr:serine/threonine-protein kinase [Mycolicibacterium rhodesiae]AEV72129.1 serine/threonine protein kinase [Mycolicibacterium rhodesiae NBB3]
MEGREALAGRYELRGLLGRGGMAEVHDGWDTRLNRAVAVKLLHPAISADVDARRRFEDEAHAAASLNHPNIVAVHDSGEHKGVPFIVMERLPGRTLGDEIAAGPMPQRRVRTMLHDVLGALATAHRAGIVHRDIKPGNVLLTDNGGAMKVADFGIAKSAGAALTATGQIVGTAAYMSPERVAGAPASVEDDLYAVGIMAHEALTGRRPYPQENPASLIRAVLEGPPPPIETVRPDVDPALAAVINASTSRASDGKRFGSAEEMCDALSGAPPPSRPATKVLAQPLAPSANYYVPSPVRRKPMTRNRKLLLAAAAFVALTVAALAFALDPSSSTQPPQPIVSSSAAPPPPPPSPTVAPPPSPEPVTVQPQPPPGKKGPGGNGRGNGNKKND